MNCELEKRHYISFCGSYCHICDWHTGKIRKTFQSALDMLEDFGFKNILEGKADLENLKSGLQMLAISSICPGCKPEAFRKPEEDRCKIRQCCSGKGFDLCCECAGFPCEILKTNPGVIKFHCIENLIKIKEKGVKEWLDKQWKEYLKA